MRLRIALLAALLAVPAASRAQPLEDIRAFERGFAVSLWQFDACGDVLAGRLFRQALAERMAQCPFSEAARTRWQARTQAEMAKTRARMTAMVEETGGLPPRLEGMAQTCRALQASEPYRAFRALLERHAAGAVPAEAVIPAACDAPDILP